MSYKELPVTVTLLPPSSQNATSKILQIGIFLISLYFNLTNFKKSQMVFLQFITDKSIVC